jgi:RNA 2',3'-cyclic 3'-phosphodiesterase
MAEPRSFRLFIALELPEEWKSLLQEEQRRLESAAPGFGRWVGPELMHLTLLFLGNQSPARMSAIESAVDAAAAASTFELQLHQLGSFGSPRSLRVVWAGVDDRPPGALSALQERVVAESRAKDIPFEQDRFSPHITLARARRDAGPTQSEAMHRALADRRDWATTGRGSAAPVHRCTEITLIRSDLRPSGPLYTPIHRASLAG